MGMMRKGIVIATVNDPSQIFLIVEKFDKRSGSRVGFVQKILAAGEKDNQENYI